METPHQGAKSLVWSDEFDGPAGSPPDPRWWICETGAHGWGNGELQAYTADPSNACHDGRGNLVIRAVREASGYTSARLITKGLVQFRYGRIEARARLPAGPGLWPAIWMLGSTIGEVGWPDCGEIDVMENVGQAPERVFGTIHCPGHAGPGGVSGTHVATLPFHRGFHVFAVDWEPSSIRWSVDGVQYFSVTRSEIGESWVFDTPFYILLNLAVGGTLGGEVGRGTAFPAELTIDHMRVYQK